MEWQKKKMLAMTISRVKNMGGLLALYVIRDFLEVQWLRLYLPMEARLIPDQT